MNFALITEGVSEHRVIKHMISKYFKDASPNIKQIQPKVIDESQDGSGGWAEVLKYCERSELKDILIENEYLVIQIDSDKSGQSPFNVNHLHPGGKTKTDAELHSEISERLSGLIKPEILEKYKDRIFFAICIHSIECWLLPLVYTDNKRKNTKNCFATLNSGLAKNNMDKIPASKNSPNGIRAYNGLLGLVKRKKDIEDISKFNVGFTHFVERLRAVPSAS